MDNFIEKTFLSSFDIVAKINIKNGTLIFLKNNINIIPINTELSAEDFWKDFWKREKIHPDDEYLFELHLSSSALKGMINTRYSGLLFSYRSRTGESYYWTNVNIFIPDEDDVTDILLCRRRITQASADMLETLEHFSRKIYKVMKCNLTNGSSRVIRQRVSEDYMRLKYIKNDYELSEEWRLESELIHKDDLKRFEHYTNHNYITDYFAAGNDELSFFYRRKIGGFYKWVKLSITKATEYSINNRIYTYIIEDIDSILTNLLDTGGQIQYFKDNSDTHNQAELYHENLTHVLSYITQKYIDFYMIDLKKDLYIMYKLNPETVGGDVPYIGSYSGMSKNYVETNMNKSQESHLLQYATPDAFKTMLKDRTSIEFTFTHVNGQLVKTICTKIASEKGIPTKVICATIPYTTDKLLKVKTFGNFDVYDENGNRIIFKRKQAKELLAYLIDKQGYPVTTKEIITDVLEKDSTDKTYIKYVSALVGYALKDLEVAGYTNIIIKEWNSLRINTEKLDCDYYHLINGDASYFHQYHNEYMKEYSWAEETNSEILHYSSI